MEENLLIRIINYILLAWFHYMLSAERLLVGIRYVFMFSFNTLVLCPLNEQSTANRAQKIVVQFRTIKTTHKFSRHAVDQKEG